VGNPNLRRKERGLEKVGNESGVGDRGPSYYNNPLFFQISEWERRMWRTYLESVYRVREWSAASSKALMTANSSAC
jgi:hypothetical protein